MYKYTPFLAVFKQVLTSEEVQRVTGQTKDYEDTGTKMTVGVLFDYFVQAFTTNGMAFFKMLGWARTTICPRFITPPFRAKPVKCLTISSSFVSTARPEM
ncbi:hypothetical protein [Paenibacillus sp. FSL R7-0128]|uniref:hypothetical protein n=1 Tax=Paenibacillus sp. FSL R7-0128 TaxID=2954529 RepID=UPI0030F5D719